MLLAVRPPREPGGSPQQGEGRSGGTRGEGEMHRAKTQHQDAGGGGGEQKAGWPPRGHFPLGWQGPLRRMSSPALTGRPPTGWSVIPPLGKLNLKFRALIRDLELSVSDSLLGQLIVFKSIALIKRYNGNSAYDPG